jgi:hypothetical protein
VKIKLICAIQNLEIYFFKKNKLDIYFFCSHVFLFIFWTKIAIRQKNYYHFSKLFYHDFYLFVWFIYLMSYLFLEVVIDWLFVGLGYPLCGCCVPSKSKRKDLKTTCMLPYHFHFHPLVWCQDNTFHCENYMHVYMLLSN